MVHMNLRFILAYLLVCYLLFYCKWVEGYTKLSKEEDLKLEQQLKRLNKPAVKTIKTKYGVVYDCVDFYKQPAFDHPLLKNHSFHPGMRSTSIPTRVSPLNEAPKLDYKQLNIGLEGGGCPNGTVPIRRTTKDDLIRAKIYSEMHASKIDPLMDQQPYTHYALFQTKQNIDYDGVGGTLNVWNHDVKAPQYTSARIKIKNGAESLEAGWMVNPGLYGDTKTHMYIYTNAGGSHCFNAQCGYVHVKPDIPVDGVIFPVSTYGKDQYSVDLAIYQDVINKNWYLKFDETQEEIGFWPSQIFTNLGNTATQAEWGGEVFSPPNVPSPPMGSGHVFQDDGLRDAFVGLANIVVNNTIMDPPGDLNKVLDELSYFTVNLKRKNTKTGYLIVYGGVGGATGN